MTLVRTLRGINETGYDASRNLLVVPVGKTGSLYLVDTSVLGTDVVTDDPTIATVTEKDQTRRLRRHRGFTADERAHPLSLLTVKGLKVGTTTLRSETTVGSDPIGPITIRVVDNADARQSGEKGAISPELRAELQELSLREAVLRVAEDQMYSKIGRNSGGFGRYADAAYDWCGAFAWYCWNVACTVKGVPNPFGTKYSSLLSCQKAISWALQTDSCTILRYEGGDPYGNSFATGKALGKAAERQEFVAIDAANPVQKADIMILRQGTPADWKHVALVWEDTPADAARVETIDGNQGSPCIQRRSRDMKAKVNNGKDFAVIVLHVLGVDG
jgi:hypothetical protein